LSDHFKRERVFNGPVVPILCATMRSDEAKEFFDGCDADLFKSRAADELVEGWSLDHMDHLLTDFIVEHDLKNYVRFHEVIVNRGTT